MLTDEVMLEQLQRGTFTYFQKQVNPANGLITDCTKDDSLCSIAAVGLALTTYPVAVECGLLTRADAIEQTLTTLRFFWRSPQGEQPDATGY